MKHTFISRAIVAFSIVMASSVLSQAQEPAPKQAASPMTDLGTTFTYQGQLKKNNQPVTGPCGMAFRVYDAASVGNMVSSPITLTTVPVTGGLFTVGLDFGTGVFTGERRWLDIAVQCSGDSVFNLLAPRQELTAAPYALALPGLWTQPNDTSPNVIGGFSANQVTGAVGAVIGGGGSSGSPNQVTADYGTVGGGANNHVTAGYGTVSGGTNNQVTGTFAAVGGGVNNNASGYGATIAGGGGILIIPGFPPKIIALVNTASGRSSTIGGGDRNRATGSYSTVGGGTGNQASGGQATIGGGATSQATGDYATVGGGMGISVTGMAATVAGGSWITASGDYASVGGGLYNRVTGDVATVGGGQYNRATGDRSTVSGGASNQASSDSSTIGGGLYNWAIGSRATVGGGISNQATDDSATVSGGNTNQATNSNTTVGGGDSNQATAIHATVGGGGSNTASGEASTVPGGAGAVASQYGQMALAAGSFAYNGDAQTSVYVARKVTQVGNMYMALRLDGSTEHIKIPSNHAMTYDILVIGRTSAGLTGGYQVRGVIENDNGTVHMIGTPSYNELGSELPPPIAPGLPRVIAEASVDDDALVIGVLGNTGVTIRWVATVRTAEVGY